MALYRCKPLSNNKIFGVRWEANSSNYLNLTRIDDAENFTDPSPAVSNGSGSSPFDNYLPWSGMERVEDSIAGTLVKIPKYYYKLNTATVNNKYCIELRISSEEQDGYYVSPAHGDRGDGKGERDYVYVGAYHCNSAYKSKSGVTPLANINPSTAATNIHNLGADYWMYDYAMYATIIMLYLVEYADFDSQSKIGYGCGNGSSVQSTGLTDAMVYHTGTNVSSRTTYGHVKYRGIEDLWANLFTFVWGSYCDSSGNWKIGYTLATRHSNLSRTASIQTTSGMWRPSVVQYNNGNTVIKSKFPLLAPTSLSGDRYNADTCVTDYLSPGGDNSVMKSGGYYNYQTRNYGLFYMGFGSLDSGQDQYTGVRVMKMP